MKTKKQKKKLLLLTISVATLIIFLIFASLFYRHQQQNKPFTLDSLDLSDWTKSDNNLSFLFPQDNISISKKFTNSYESNSNIFKWGSPNTREPIPNNEIENKVNNQPEVKSIVNQLKKQKFIKRKDLSGLLLGNYGVTYENIRYLITYQRDNIFCQIHETFECNSKGCYGLYSYFGCGQFDLEKDFQTQKHYYNIYQSQNKLFITEYLSEVQEGKKYIFFNLSQIGDGNYIYINKQDNKIDCSSKVCCSSYTKNDSKFWGDWCTDNYQTVDTYQPVGL